MGHSPAKNLRSQSRRNSWFSFNPNCMARSSITSWQTEDEVPDDVALDFGSTGFDGISARTEITVGPDAFVNGAGVAAGDARAIDKGIWSYGYLRSRGNTIEAGTSEVQRNIIGHFVLRLPRSY